MGGFDLQSFAGVLREMRRAAGLTQEGLASASGVAVRTISDLERGISRSPQGDSGALLADALGLAGNDREAFFASIRSSRRMPGPKPLSVAPAPPLEETTLGREDEISAIDAMIDRGERIVSLVGIGGIGKTRIATEIATRRALRGREYVAWTSLVPLTDPNDVIPAIARAFRMTDLPATDPVSHIAEALSGKRVLLVLDNLEHVLDAAAGISALVAAAPSLSVLTTSREALRIAGELIVPIEPLAVPDDGEHGKVDAGLAANPAVALFLRGHAEAIAGYAPGHAEPGLLDAAARIVRMVDGMPLAIELAAAQSSAMAPEGIADLLEHSALAVLSAGRRDGPARFRTMEAALAWSANLLPEPAMRLLRLLGIFRGGFTTDAAAGVAAAFGAPHLVAMLPTLANHYLIRPAARVEGRYVMLEPVRMFALALLEEHDEAEAARHAHAAWFLRWAGKQALGLAGADPLPALDTLDADLPNLQVAIAASAGERADADADPAAVDDALRTVGELRRFWEYRSHYRMAIALIDDAVEAAESRQAPSPALLEAVFSASYFATLLGDVATARRSALRLHALAAETGLHDYEVRALVLDAIRARYNAESPEEALPLARRALAAAESAPGSYGQWAAMLTLGGHLQEIGEAAEALPLLEGAVRMAADRGCALDQSVPLSRLGFTLLDLGRLDDADRRLIAAADIAERLDSVSLAIFSVLGLARTAALRADETGLTRSMILTGGYQSMLERITMASSDYSFSPYWDEANADNRARAVALLGLERVEDLIARGHEMELPGIVAFARG